MNFQHSIAAILVTSVIAAAQTFTSPKGYDAVEGSGNHGNILGSVDGLRFQQVDSSLKGTPYANVKSIAWRRDATLATGTTYGSRTFEQMSVLLAHSTLAPLSTDFAANYKGAPTVVFTPKHVSAPDWNAKPATSPASFDLKLLFDTQWSYNGTDDFLWEVQMVRVTTPGSGVRNYPFDFQSASGVFTTSAEGVALGTGCLALGQTSRRFYLHTTMYDDGTRFKLRHSVNFAPQNSAIFTLLDAVDANQAVAGLCAVLHAMPTVVLSLGTASSGGSVPAAFVNDIPYLAAAIGQNVYLQSLGLDNSQTGLKVALSQGTRQTVPAIPTRPNVGRVHGYTAFNASWAYGPFAGGVIAQFGYQ